MHDEAAHKLIGLKADAKTRAAIEKLARRCNQGEATAEERDEHATYVLAGDFIAIQQAQARLRFSRRHHAPEED